MSEGWGEGSGIGKRSGVGKQPGSGSRELIHKWEKGSGESAEEGLLRAGDPRVDPR